MITQSSQSLNDNQNSHFETEKKGCNDQMSSIIQEKYDIFEDYEDSDYESPPDPEPKVSGIPDAKRLREAVRKLREEMKQGKIPAELAKIMDNTTFE